MDIYDITLKKVRNKQNLDDSSFLSVYKKLVLFDGNLSNEEKSFILKVAIYFLNSKDQDIERFGYKIILRYCNQFNDYEPLRDIALSRDYIPIAKFIENHHLNQDDNLNHFSDLYLKAYQENFKIDGDGENLYRSLGQLALSKFSLTEDNIAVVAPTSYGKSEMIVRKVRTYPTKKVCVIVPSKALLAQTKNVLLRDQFIRASIRKIITHPDMYKESDESFVAVLTQERLLILLQKNRGLSLDLVLVDEAHNMLEDTMRAHLLAQVLLILKKRNANTLVNFFTPFLVDTDNLNIKNQEIDILGQKIEEYMKVELFYSYDIEKQEMHLYDQFLDRPFPILNKLYRSDIDLILQNKSSKNIIYLNRPIVVEDFAIKLANEKDPITITPEIDKVIASISEIIHPEYNLIECIKHGVLYHHGGIPDVIKLYIEEVFSKYSQFEFIVTTSTLLEGVNIPAQKIFILTPRKGRSNLTGAQFKNLIGRICRFKDVFDHEKGDLKLLEPMVYLVKGSYAPRTFSPLSFYNQKVNSSVKHKDAVVNPLLEESTNTETTQQVLAYLENVEPGSSGLINIPAPTTDIGRFCFVNNVHDFNILSNEEVLNANLDYFKTINGTLINSAETLINAIVEIFFKDVTLEDSSDNINRIKNNEIARNFYSMFLTWRSEGAPYPLMISRFLAYWKRREEDGATLIYVGAKWGDRTRDGGHQTLFVDISEKNEIERINLAIAKIKEEQEFVDFYIIKYLEILNDLELVNPNFYDQIKYGTTNRNLICMLKNGFSMELAKVLLDRYADQLNFDLDQDIVQYGQDLLNLMRTNNENDILLFEAESYL